MYGLTRGTATLLGAAVAGTLLWLATQVGDGSTGGYWAVYGLLAGGGLAMALSQLLGGWTKWGWPRVTTSVFLLAFLPVLVIVGWLLLAHQPDANWFRTHVLSWSGDVGVGGLVADLREYVPVAAFALGLVFGFTFDTTGRRREAVVEPPREARPLATPAADRRDADEPLAAERDTVPATEPDREAEPAIGRRWFGLRRTTSEDGGTAVAERPPRRTDD